MPDKPTAKEVSIDLAGFKSSVDKQFAAVDRQLAAVDKLLYWVLGVCVTIILGIITGGYSLQSAVSDVKSGLTDLRGDVKRMGSEFASIDRRLEKLEGRLDATANFERESIVRHNEVVRTLIALQNSISTSPIQIFPLTEDERQAIRRFYGIDKGPSKYKPKFVVGQIASGSELLPDAIVQQVPQLKGFRIDRDPGDGSVLIIAENGRIVAIIQPA